MNERMTGDDVLEIGRSYQRGQALLAAAELAVYENLGRERLAASDLAQRLGTDARATAILLNALAATGLLAKDAERFSVPEHLVPLLVEEGDDNVLAMVRHQATSAHRWDRLASVAPQAGQAEFRRRIARWRSPALAWRTISVDELGSLIRQQFPTHSPRHGPSEHLNDRAADNWEPLLAIADLAGGAWPSIARRAAVALSIRTETDTEALGLLLLGDIRDVFGQLGTDRISSAELVERLKAMTDRPWARGSEGPLTAIRLAAMLRPFGIRPGTIRLADGSTPKGYARAAFEQAWEHLLSRHNATGPVHNDLPRISADGDRDPIEREAS